MSTRHLTVREHAIGIFLVGSFIFSPWAHAQQFTNGSFESPETETLTTISDSNDLEGWSITQGNVSVNRSTWTASDGDQSLELNGTTAGAITQTVGGFTVGEKYILSVTYGAHALGGYANGRVTINGRNAGYIEAATANRVPNYKTAKIEFTATGSNIEFGFRSLSQGNKGLVLDNIKVSRDYDSVETQEEAARFLISSTFGPTLDSISDLTAKGYSSWYRDQLSRPVGLALPRTSELFDEAGRSYGFGSLSTSVYPKAAWLENALSDNDQLRQRAAFALSQIFVTSSESQDYKRKVQMAADYQDILARNAFGNFRDILQDVTYSPMMGTWLTYLGNEGEDPETGAFPDENYAREIMQLFTIGLVELDSFGNAKLDNQGEEIPTYDADDIRGLAKVFTGLNWAGRAWSQQASIQPQSFDLLPLEMNNNYHATGTKSFLDNTIPDYGDGDKTIDTALDIIFNHPNVGPFIGKQLIQRFTTSNPGPSYMLRVTRAFNNGVYTLPDGTTVGSGERGDMQAVWAAVLFGSQTFGHPEQLERWGKVREPVIRLVHWARVAGVSRTGLANGVNIGGQIPYSANSVFNFYRPGYVAPKSVTAELGYVAPELQISDGVNLIDYQNQMKTYTFRVPIDLDVDPDDFYPKNFLAPSYPMAETYLSESAQSYVDYLNLVLTGNRMEAETVARIVEAVEAIDLPEDAGYWRDTSLRRQAAMAMFLATTTVEYLTQQTL